MPTESEYEREIARLKKRVEVLEREKLALLEGAHDRMSIELLRHQVRELETRIQEEGKRITGLRIDTKSAIDVANEKHRKHNAEIASSRRIIEDLQVKVQVLEESRRQQQEGATT